MLLAHLHHLALAEDHLGHHMSPGKGMVEGLPTAEVVEALGLVVVPELQVVFRAGPSGRLQNSSIRRSIPSGILISRLTWR